jgi:hypothetical protein
MPADFRGGDVNAVLRLVKSLTAPDDGDAQLSILTEALIVACRSCGVSKEDALPIIAAAFDAERKLVPLESSEAVGS